MADSNPSRRMSAQFTVSPTVHFARRPFPWGLERFVRAAINNSEDFGERFANGFFAAPTRHSLCNEIEIGDIPENVRLQRTRHQSS